ncbi:hypothetical protein AS593_15590 [Caulobacter vibrioides]|nr:hypothetical protein AS593_15590 [Caulobacter vibrioides]
MRRALSAFMLVAALASSAGAQTRARPAVPAAPAEASAPSSAQAVIPPPLPLQSPRPGADPAACKAVCAKTYYFCRANTDDDSCPGEWARCDARCKATFVRPN